MITRKLITLLLLLLFLSGCQGRTSNSSPSDSDKNQVYIENKGSDTIVNIALAWAEKYQNIHSDISISVTGGGSGTGIAALINNTVDIANASRRIKNEEIESAKENGVEPIEFVIARDAIAVIINPENPIEELTLQQISDIYSGKYTNWTELGGEDRPIVRLSRETNSGTHVYFLEQVVRLGDKENTVIFTPMTLLLPSSEGIISEVSQNPNAIGYDGLGYITDEVKVIGVLKDVNIGYIYPSVETVNSGEYPIARDLYMYTNGQPEGAVLDYLNWIFSEEAQEIVTALGFVPIIQ